MYKGYKIKPLIFAGRADTMSILFPLLQSDIIDEVLVGVNTTNQPTWILYIIISNLTLSLLQYQ